MRTGRRVSCRSIAVSETGIKELGRLEELIDGSGGGEASTCLYGLRASCFIRYSTQRFKI